MSPREILPDLSAQKTVYVIGAGASVDFGLPTGEKLKEHISDKLNFQYGHRDLVSGSQRILDSIRLEIEKLPFAQRNDAFQQYHNAGLAIHKALPGVRSIDNYIHTRGDSKYIAHCGKLAIAEAILDAEKNSSLHFPSPNHKFDLRGLENKWLVSFLKILHSDCSLERLESRLENLAMIIFNYDRCVEHFLRNALQIVYEISPADAARLVNKIEIHHPYGAVGALPEHGMGTSEGRFGFECNPTSLLKIADGLKTFTEGVDSASSFIVRIRALMHNSPRIVFLGFAYYEQNMDLLFGSHPYESELDRPQTVFGTTYEVSENNAAKIFDDIVSRTNLRSSINPKRFIQLANQTCFKFINDHDRSLAF